MKIQLTKKYPRKEKKRIKKCFQVYIKQLEKYNIKKEYSETAKLQLKEELIEDFKKGNKIIYPNKIYKFKYSQFVGDVPTYTIVEKGKDILKDLYYSEYFYMDASSSKHDYTTDCVQFDLVRRNNEIDWDIWSRYKTLISSF